MKLDLNVRKKDIEMREVILFLILELPIYFGVIVGIHFFAHFSFSKRTKILGIFGVLVFLITFLIVKDLK